MITLFTGSPGAGKTASLVDYLSKLDGSRPIYSDGLNGLTLPHIPCDASTWHKDLPDGAILVIDEAQRHWRPRGAAAKVPESIAELETHRHRGIDVYLTTQSPKLIDNNVRQLIGRHIHIRDTGILGRYWYEWPECNDSMSWKTCVNKKRYSLPKKAFDLYKSSSLHTTPVRGVPRALYVMIFAFIALAFLAFGVYRITQKISSGGVPPAESSPALQVQNAPQNQGGSFPVASAAGVDRPIDDRIDWIPRVSNKPESAPAYDHLRVVVVMPVVTMGMCMGDDCVCRTQQGTNAGLSSRECRQWIENPPFNPYHAPERERDKQGQPQQGNLVQPARASPLSGVPAV